MTFDGQRGAAILEHEAGLTLIRPQFRHVPAAVEIEPGWAAELWVQDGRLEEVSGPAFIYGLEQSPRTEINLTGLTCRQVPVFAQARESGQSFVAPAENYTVHSFFSWPALAICQLRPAILDPLLHGHFHRGF